MKQKQEQEQKIKNSNIKILLDNDLFSKTDCRFTSCCSVPNCDNWEEQLREFLSQATESMIDTIKSNNKGGEIKYIIKMLYNLK